MEIAIVALAALAALVFIDTCYWISISVVRWGPVVAAGVLAFWIARHHGVESLDALAIGFLTSLAARNLLGPRYLHDGWDR